MSSQARIPEQRAFWLPILQALRDMGGLAHIRELEDRVVAAMGFTEEQQALVTPNGGRTLVSARFRWTCTELRLRGEIANPSRGLWQLTDAGWAAAEGNAQEGNPPGRGSTHLGDSIRELAPAREKQSLQDDALSQSFVDVEVVSPPVDAFASTDPDVWRNFLLDALKAMPPYAFERLCQQVLRAAGFVKVNVTGRTGDGGIDGIGVMQVSLLSFQVLFQCKRYQGSVGAGPIRDFRGAMVGRSDKGLFITTGTFTSSARQEATRDGAPVLDLIDGEALCDLLKQHSIGVSTRQVEEVTVDTDWFRTL